MTQNSTDAITQAQVEAAEAAEQSELNEAQKKHLLTRVVTLRVHLDQTKQQLSAALLEIERLRGQLDYDTEPEEGDSNE